MKKDTSCKSYRRKATFRATLAKILLSVALEASRSEFAFERLSWTLSSTPTTIFCASESS